MLVWNDSGEELNAEFHVEPDSAGLTLILGSAGGTGPNGKVRNSDYAPALRLLLERLQLLDGVLTGALVDSRRTSALPEEDRWLHLRERSYPVRLSDETDFESLRLALTTAQGRIGLPSSAKKEGNNRKRLRLRVEVPGFLPTDAPRLAELLGRPAASKLDEDVDEGRVRLGFLTNAQRRSAIELHAMRRATEYFTELGYLVRDVSARQPWDLLCVRKGTETHVEVKGTSGAGEAVILTRGEVKHARQCPDAALFVLYGITVRDDGSGPSASGGRETVIHPWQPEPERLDPLQYAYQVPNEQWQ